MMVMPKCVKILRMTVPPGNSSFSVVLNAVEYRVLGKAAEMGVRIRIMNRGPRVSMLEHANCYQNEKLLLQLHISVKHCHTGSQNFSDHSGCAKASRKSLLLEIKINDFSQR